MLDIDVLIDFVVLIDIGKVKEFFLNLISVLSIFLNSWYILIFDFLFFEFFLLFKKYLI